MTPPVDKWPDPQYHVGPAKHLHALGVISMVFNALERGMADLYRHHMSIQKFPVELVDLYYFGLDEQRRLRALKTVFKKYEKDFEVRQLVENFIDYFDWCWQSRNQLLHSEFYPSIFRQDEERLHVSKRKSKREPTIDYFWLDLSELRIIADKIEFGKRSVAALRIYLRQRDTPVQDWPVYLRAHGREPLPKKLERPAALAIAPHPFDGPIPHYLLKPSQE
jgi:hypothetical protein